MLLQCLYPVGRDWNIKQDEILYEVHTRGRNSKYNAAPLAVFNPSPPSSIIETTKIVDNLMFSVQLANISTRCSDPYVLLSVHQSSTTGSKCDDVITMSLHVVER